MNELLLDTCSVVWLANGDPIHPKATERLNANYREGQSTYASPFSAWELGILVSRSRLRLERPVLRWFEDFLDKGQITLAALSVPVLVDSSFLPGTAPSDPADRIIIATARTMNLTILTRDRQILDYSKEGHVRAMKC
ncbi:MAG: type II toxin-antitoxin system VapC family toxin [Boseongicola sp. SB0662_bin_57]|nr:type II toxin-antitoxin system VapC family toxin [Boseongicola sp. SB0662_bin_57]